MKKYFSPSLLVLMIIFAGAGHLRAQDAQPAHADWPTGAIYAVNVKERKLVLDKQVFRVALKASISDANDKEMSLSELEPQYVVAYRLEADTGDIVDIITVAIP